MQEEIWRIIPSYPDYAASSHGRIKRTTPRKYNCTIKKEILKLRKDHNGYYVVTLMKPNSNKYRPIHVNRCVCEAFHGIAPTSRHHAAHEDGNRINNLPSNLSWKSAAENVQDQIRHGTMSRGEGRPNSRLKEKDINNIRMARKNGLTWLAIAKEYGVTPSAIRGVCEGRTWKHVA